MKARHEATQKFRVALIIGTFAPAFEYLAFLREGIQNRYYELEDGFFESYALGGLLVLLAVFPPLWYFGIPVIERAAIVFHVLLGGQVPREKWLESTFSSLWTLPYASLMGVLTWLVYSVFLLGGWPGDVIFGIIANLIGAWCYGTIFWNWHILRRQYHRATAVPRAERVQAEPQRCTNVDD